LSACQRARLAMLSPLLEDEDEDVRGFVAERLSQQQD
jgi:hypothetical protein